jgi:hypothetical protein
MSKHLIQAPSYFGTKYCINSGATTPPWRTVSIGLDETTSDQWDVYDSTFVFITCCVWKFTIRFTLNDFSDIPGVGLNYSLELNGEYVLDEFPPGSSFPETYDHVIDLNELGVMGDACGNYWNVTALYQGTVEIIDVEFGPPV